MPMIQKMRHCSKCKATTVHIQNVPHGTMHVLLSLVTAGLWIPIWILAATVMKDNPRCTSCGNRAWM